MCKSNNTIYYLGVLACLVWFSSFLYANGNDQKTLIIVSASWCQPCHIAKHDMENDSILSSIVKRYEIIDIDYDIDKDVVDGYNIKTVPTFVVMHQGKEIKRKTGYTKKELIEFLDK